MSDKKYEDKRPARKVNPNGKIGRSWLELDIENNNMKCNICIGGQQFMSGNLKAKNTFISEAGCTNIKLSAVMDHENSQKEYRVKKLSTNIST